MPVWHEAYECRFRLLSLLAVADADMYRVKKAGGHNLS